MRLGQSLRALLKSLALMEAMAADLRRLYERGSELLVRLARFAAAAEEDSVRWLEVGRQHLRMLESPLSIARIMQERLLQRSGDEIQAGLTQTRMHRNMPIGQTFCMNLICASRVKKLIAHSAIPTGERAGFYLSHAR